MDPFSLAVQHYEAGRLQQAAAAVIDHLRRRPSHVDGLRLLGMILLGLGHADDALATLDRAVAAGKRDPAAHANRAQVLRALGRIDEAAAALGRATSLDPKLVDAWAELGAVEQARGNAEASALALGRALELRADRSVAVALADRIATLPDPPTALAPALLVAARLDGVDHTRFDRLAERVLLPLRDDPERLARHPVLHAWLARGTVHHPDWERALIATRSWLLRQVAEGAAVEPAALVAFGLYGWSCEYAWDVPEADQPDVLGDGTLERAARAMYGPVGPDEHELLPLRRVAVDEPATEEALAAEIVELVGSDDAALQGMYEENPYPRTVAVQVRPPVSFDAWIRAALPLSEEELPPKVPLEVLVAGCGTGRHALTSACTWADCEVTGIDLSRRSLARAARRAKELGVDHLRVLRADLTRLGSWDRRFDLVESVGVLHHLEDPEAGLAVLAGLLKPGGWLRFGLYSELGRADVVAARAFVAGHGFPATAEGIRAARAALLQLPADHPARPVVYSADFASISGCRDLIFHVREHRFTTERLAAALAGAGLRFVGFQHVDPAVPAAYTERWPDDRQRADLARWGEIERERPRAFSGMYVGWAVGLPA
ncbi:MAG: methyltransferase domain-containing protein [Alphaproteobacteria bacterium]|nr:methyltransferase domain-containing protein [Alphaproteobacteria bacterium]MCB9696393.1 methyltransferase domain-containing protein [Alphaproteobacteria bacterium]